MELSPFRSGSGELVQHDHSRTLHCYSDIYEGGGEGGREGEKGKKVVTENFLVRAHASS